MKKKILVVVLLITIGAGTFIFFKKSTGCPSGDPNVLVSMSNIRGEGQSLVSPMQLAAGSEDSNCLKMLLDRGGDPNTKNIHGQPILFNAADLHSVDLEAAKRNIQLLLDKGADINAVSRGGATVALYEAEAFQWEFVAYLIEKGVNVTLADKNGTNTIARMLEVDIKNNPNPGTAVYAANREKVKNLLIKQGVIFK